MAELQCYNKGCGKKFKEDDNSDTACVYHPGVPVFHDAMKGWSCCNKKSTDFSTFLSMPGCTKGSHNPVKPVEPVKAKSTPLAPGEVIEVKGQTPLKPPQPMERPSDDIPYTVLKVSVSNSLKSAISRLKLQEQNTAPNNETNNSSNDSNTINIGTKCKRSTCEVKYEGPETDLTECHYHPGTAIFHEGYKFWTCCQKRTSDFNEFMRQEGCKSGDHLWKEDESKKTNCRYDWHQTGSHIVVSVYAKCIVAEQSCVKANPTNVSVALRFEGGKGEYTNMLKLAGVIDPSRSSVELLGTKAEIKLRKAEALGWKTLHYKET